MAEAEPIFKTEELQEATGVPEATIKEYLRLDFLTPAYPSSGARQRHGFSFANLMQTKIVKRLSESEVHRSWIAPISFGLPFLTLEPNSNPFSLKFASDIPVQRRDFSTPKIELITNYCRSFYKVGLKVNKEGEECFYHKLVKKTPKAVTIPDLKNYRALSTTDILREYESISIPDLTEEGIEDLMEYSICISLVLNEIHSNLRRKLTGMGLI